MGGRPRVNTTITGTSPRNASCAHPEARFVVGGGVHGVGGVANDRSALVLCATAAPGRKRRRGWWRRPRSSMASCGWPAASGVEAGGGVRARAWQAAAGQQQAASRLVAASALEHGKLRLASSKVRGRLVVCMALVTSLTIASSCFCVLRRRRGWWRRPRSSMASCGWPAASGVEAGGGVRARAWQAAAPQQQGVSGSVAEAGGGVRAADGNLPLPSRRFMIPEVGRSWRY
ncbi:hypothetical protein PR001_g23761 [Phytophthora rubi]|uniref:Uncharacterized protein n=1 Tax=Phytophthora rubi TaxID=129364 RepID=A0A6A3IH23_9STRA|nr:hypothetical protein PR001_g23761 [Phytophthora rubi]